MKKIIISAVFSVLLPLFASAQPEKQPQEITVPGMVNAEAFLNVRLGAKLNSPVVGKLPSNAEVKILRVVQGWLEIKAPESLPVFISEARVGADNKLVSELNMRPKMGTDCTPYGLLPAGTEVKRLDKRANGWVQIVPPENLKVYVAAMYVTFDRSKFAEDGLPVDAEKAAAPAAEKAAAPAAEKAAAPAAEKAAAPAAEKAAAPAAEKAAAPAAAVKSAEKKIELDGFIINWKYSKAAFDYALIDSPKGKNIAFLTADTPVDLNAKLDTAVKVSGIVTGKTDAGIPIVKVTSVTEKNAAVEAK